MTTPDFTVKSGVVHSMDSLVVRVSCMGWTGYGRIKTSLPDFISSEGFRSSLSDSAVSVQERSLVPQISQSERKSFEVLCADNKVCMVIAEWDPRVQGGMWMFKVLPEDLYQEALLRLPVLLEDDDPLAPLLKYQEGLCGICRKEKRLVVDHDHITQMVRGYLCLSCNSLEGTADYPWIREYRENPPAKKIGLIVRYGQHLPSS